MFNQIRRHLALCHVTMLAWLTAIVERRFCWSTCGELFCRWGV